MSAPWYGCCYPLLFLRLVEIVIASQSVLLGTDLRVLLFLWALERATESLQLKLLRVDPQPLSEV